MSQRQTPAPAPRPKPRPLARITRELLEPVWCRHDIPTARIAARLGVSRQAVSLKARTLGLPSRAQVKTKAYADDETFRRMWLAGVSGPEMARHLGYTNASSIYHRRVTLGLPTRARGSLGCDERISLAQFQEMELARAMRGTGRAGRKAAP